MGTGNRLKPELSSVLCWGQLFGRRRQITHWSWVFHWEAESVPLSYLFRHF